MGVLDTLKKVFNWPSAKRPVDKPPVTAKERALAQMEQQSSPANVYHNEMDFAYQRRQDRYDVYDAMDEMSDVASVLDAYAEDATQKNEQTKKTVWVESSNKEIREELNHLLHNVLHVEDCIEGIARDLGKYGDDFGKLLLDSSDGIRSIRWRDPRDVERIENRDGILLGFEEQLFLGEYRQKISMAMQAKQDPASIKPTYEPWDVVHFRIYKRKRLAREKIPNIYGTSLLAGSERIAKQVKILDDLLMIVRLTRSLDRKTYYVDVGKTAVEEEASILRRWRRALKRKTYVDPATGRFDSRFDPFGWTEDEFWPAKEGSTSRVETQQGLTNIADIVDIDHFRDKFFGSLRAPKAYFGYEGDVNAKATLSSQSVKWARAVVSLQRALIQGFTRLCQIHLALLGKDANAENFQVMMEPPSIVELLNKLEAWQTVIDVAERMSTLGETLQLDKRDWTIYILENVLWLSKQDVRKFIRKLPKEEPPEQQQPDQDQKQQAQQPAQQQTEPQIDVSTLSPPAHQGSPEGKGRESKSNGVGLQRLDEIEDLISRIEEHRDIGIPYVH